ncbi:MAG: TonB-dependent receptor [Saprospiraceae bacterium]
MIKNVSYVIFFIFFAVIVKGQIRPDAINISYSAFQKPLYIVLRDLSSISGVNIVFSDSRIPSEKKININAKNETIGTILTVILDDYDLTYQIVGNQLVVVKNESKYTHGEIRIYGKVRDRLSGEYLIGANVFLHDRQRGTSTNETGNYSLKIDKQRHRIHFSYLGYKSQIVEFNALKDSMLNISLQPDGLLNEIVIMDNLMEEVHEQPADQQNLHIDKIRSSNHLGGEADLFRYLASQPGISTAAEGVGGLNIRGGSADQNLVLLDEVPVYNTGHALGIFSIFNSDAIKSVSLYKGGIPARYAGRLSSVIDVHTRDGNFQKLKANANLSIIAMSGTIEGPIIKDKGSFMISYRRTFMDVWIKELTKQINRGNNKVGNANYFFSDINAKLNIRLNKKTRLLLQSLSSNDEFSNDIKSKPGELREENANLINWGNSLYSIRLHRDWGKSLFSRTVAYTTNYNFESYKNNLFGTKTIHQDSIIFNASLYASKINEVGLKHEFDWMASKIHRLKLGANYQSRRFNPLALAVSERDISKEPSPEYLHSLRLSNGGGGDEVNIFTEDNISLGSGVQINLGLNYSLLISGSDKIYSTLQPRFALLADGDNLHFKIGAAKMQQYIHLLTNSGLGLPADVWLPSSNILAPQTSWIFNTSFGYRLNSGLRFGAEVYYKSFKNISSFKEGSGIDISAGNDWESEVPVGKGSAYGFETYFEKVFGKTLFNVNYTYSISDRLFADLNNGNIFPFNLNRNHSLKCSFNYRISQFTEFLVNWTYQTGNYFSKPLNVTFNTTTNPIVIFPEKNNASFVPFHRLDAGFSLYNNYRWGRTKFFIGIYNAYNRNNPFYTDLVRDPKNEGRYEFRQFSLLTVLPTVSYSISI